MHCNRHKQYIEFKQSNPYAEKELEFECLPTPRLHKDGTFQEYDQTKNN